MLQFPPLIVRVAIFVFVLYFIGYGFFTYWYDISWLPPSARRHTNDDRISKLRNPLTIKEKGLSLEKESRLKNLSSSLIRIISPEPGPLKTTIDPISLISEASLKKIANTSITVHNRFGIVYFALINDAFRELTANWLCNLQALQEQLLSRRKNKKRHSKNIHNSKSAASKTNGTLTLKAPNETPERVKILEALIIVALEQKTCHKLGKQWPKVNCLDLSLRDRQLQKELNEPTQPKSPHFIDLLKIRMFVATEIVKKGLKVAIVEPDSIWLFSQQSKWDQFQNSIFSKDADIILPNNSYAVNYSMVNKNMKQKDATLTPLVVNPTRAASMVLDELLKRLVEGNNNSTANGQTNEKELINQSCNMKQAKCESFPPSMIASGAWLKLAENEREKLAHSNLNGSKNSLGWPIIVNNDAYFGVLDKVARLKTNGFWFLKPKEGQRCWLAKAKKTLSSFKTHTRKKFNRSHTV